jgi:EAL domain-containing protein (putative c-di-GMP-specific phosphodiesterase class I)
VSSTRHKVYRVGGDEFVIVDNFKHKENLYDFAKFLSEQHIVFEDEGVDLVLSASIGVIERVGDVMVEDIFNPRSYLLSLADHTMYRAKKDAVIKIKYCTKEDIESHLLKIEIENIAEKPIQEVGIYPVFQPIYNYKDKSIVGFEALARWENEGDSYMPDQFIPVFENLNKIAELDIYIFESAVAMLEKYLELNPHDDQVFVTSNFSVKSLGFLKVADFNRVMAKYKVPKKNVLIEITESTFFDNNCYKLIESLKDSDYYVAIDDFSSGHSTINSIVALDVDVVKIDKYIVENISKKMVREEDYYKELLILEAITKLIKSIESKVIVEGIESDMIDQVISSAEIDFVQGNNYSLPIKIEEVFKLNK